MALVHIDLSELDALRDALKENKEAKIKLEKELEEKEKSHAKEVEGLKSGAYIIERTPTYKTSSISVKIHSLSIELSKYLDRLIYERKSVNSREVENILSRNSNTFEAQSYSQSETIERVVGFREVEKEIRQHFEKKNKSLLEKYQETIDNVKKLRESLLKEFEDKETTIFKMNAQRIQETEERCKKSLELMSKEYEEKIKLLDKDKTLQEALKSLGYKTKSTLFGTKLVKL